MIRSMFARFAGLGIAAAMAVGVMPTSAMAFEQPVPVPWTMDTTANPVSGQDFTFSPQYPEDFTVPADAVCQYELRWGDDASLLNNVWNSSFGAVVLRGTNEQGYCHGWTFTLPYSSASQWQWTYGIVDSESNPLIENMPSDWLSDEYPLFTGTNGVPAGTGITESTLPGVWASLSANMMVEKTVTATAHPFGGYVIPEGGITWMAYGPGDESEYHGIQGTRSMTFSFVPHTPGNWSAWFNDAGDPQFAGAGVDPAVRRAAQSVKLRLQKSVRRKHFVPFEVVATGFRGRVTCVISINHKNVLRGCSGRLLFTTVGTRKVTATVTDRHGHRARKTVVIAVTR